MHVECVMGNVQPAVGTTALIAGQVPHAGANGPRTGPATWPVVWMLWSG
jgi:hypothetical protein